MAATKGKRETRFVRRVMNILAVVLVLSSIATPAAADWEIKRDRNDTAGPLDIARIVHKHREGHPNVFIHKIVMHETWRPRALRSTLHESRYITVTFDVRRNVGYPCTSCITEREVIIRFQEGELRATLYNHLGDPPRKLGSLRVWRPNTRAVAFSVKRSQLRRSDFSSYDWGVQTLYTKRGSDTCPPRRGCFDLAPNRRSTLLTHRL